MLCRSLENVFAITFKLNEEYESRTPGIDGAAVDISLCIYGNHGLVPIRSQSLIQASLRY